MPSILLGVDTIIIETNTIAFNLDVGFWVHLVIKLAIVYPLIVDKGL